MPYWDHDPVPPPSRWPLFWSLLVVGTVGALLILILIAGHNA